MPSPEVVTTEAIAANTAIGASDMTYAVTLRMTCESSSIQLIIAFALSPSAAAAAPKNTENTTIWRISLLAIASKALRGTRCVTNSLNEIDATLRLVEAEASGRGRLRASPGASRFTMTSPRSSENRDAEMNHAMVLTPMRPIAAVSPICAMPTTSVENTSGAMIILINRRKMSVNSEMYPAVIFADSGVGSSSWHMKPTPMPASIPMKIQVVSFICPSLRFRSCVPSPLRKHRFDLSGPQRHALADLEARAVAPLDRASLARVHLHGDLVRALPDLRLHLRRSHGADAPFLVALRAGPERQVGDGAHDAPVVRARPRADVIGRGTGPRGQRGPDVHLADRADLAARLAHRARRGRRVGRRQPQIERLVRLRPGGAGQCQRGRRREAPPPLHGYSDRPCMK